MVITIDDLVAKIDAIPRRNKTLIIGIDGGGGAGKSTLAEEIRKCGNHVTVVQTDDFYKPSKLREGRPPIDAIGFNWEWERIRSQVLEPMNGDIPGEYQRYDWVSDQMAEWHIVPVGGIVIVEGCYSIRKELKDLYDYRIWINTTKSTRLRRGIDRDGEEARTLWEEEWMPAEEEYFIAHKPLEYADMVIDGTGTVVDINNHKVNVII